MLKTIREYIGKAIFVALSLAIGLVVGTAGVNALNYYQTNHIPEQEYAGLPSYNGPCGTMIRNAYNAFAANQNLNDNPSHDTKQNIKYYINEVQGTFNIAAEQSSFCQDTEAIGRLLYLRANSALDAVVLKIRTADETCPLIENIMLELKALKYFNAHPEQQILLSNRLSRCYQLIMSEPIKK